MKLYIVEVDGETVGCETSLKAAKLRITDDDWCITVLEVAVTAETVRLLLGNKGGYAETLRTIEP